METENHIPEGFDAVHNYFGLSYSNYLVLHRSLLQSMPCEWQARFVKCLEELNEAFAYVEQPSCYEVVAAEEKEYDELTPAERKALGVKMSRHATPIFWDNEGNEHQGWERALVPTLETIPHYNRGRTRIEPQLA